jgi:Domain of unknown function (DUF4281)
MMLSQLFNIATLFVLPFWALMILLPNWKFTQCIMKSYLPFLALAVLYLYLFITSITSDTQALLNPHLENITKLFTDERAITIGWIHFIVVDFFVGRFIYWEGQRTGIYVCLLDH